jgi:hypothetical protein
MGDGAGRRVEASKARAAAKSLPCFGTRPRRAATEGGPYTAFVGDALRGGPACP